VKGKRVKNMNKLDGSNEEGCGEGDDVEGKGFEQ
jgi:hypothetical protein